MSLIYIRIKSIYPFLIGLLFVLDSCKKFVDIDGPLTSVSGKNVYTNDATAIAVLTGIYTTMSQNSIQGSELTSVGFITGLSSDELILYNQNMDTRLISYYHNSLSANNQSDNFWNSIYTRLYILNSAIEGLSNANLLTEKVKTQLLGEAKFLRAMCYFYLTNLYGDVPLVVSSDYTANKILARAPQEQVWNQIISDLKDSQILLNSDYLDATLLKSTPERVRPNKWAATALLARAYLYVKDWTNAEKQASNIINFTSLYKLDSLNGTFKRNSMEAIWQLQPVLTGWNTEDAKTYIIPPEYGPMGASGVYLSQNLLNSFALNDQRKKRWINSITYDGSVYPFAYKYQLNTYGDNVNEYNTVLRLAEQYLIRAESRAHLTNLNGAGEDINIIRSRAGLENVIANTQDAMLSSILEERKLELFTEWGHRWFDIKRTNNVNKIMTIVTPMKGGSWNSNWQWFPIPLYEIQTNTNINQNNGY